MTYDVTIKMRATIIHHFVFQGKIWIVGKIDGEPMLWNESDIKEPILRD